MDRKIQKIKVLVEEYLNKSSKEIIQQLGRPSGVHLSDELMFYEKDRCWLCKDEICFIMKDDFVVDIVVTEYLFGIAFRNIFYFENEYPTYKAINIFSFSRSLKRCMDMMTGA